MGTFSKSRDNLLYRSCLETGDQQSFAMPCVVTQAASRLSVRSRPPTWLMGVVWVIFLSCAYWILPTPRLQVQRTGSGMANVLIEHRLLGMTLSRKLIENVVGAGVQTQKLTRLVLFTSKAVEPVNKGYSVGAEHHEAAAAKLDAFLQQLQSPSTVITVGVSPETWIAGVFLAGCVVLVTIGGRMECTLDADQDRVTLCSLGLFGRRIKEYRLSEIERFLVLQKDNLDWESRKQHPYWFNIGFRLQNGKEVPITRLPQAALSDERWELLSRLEAFRRDLSLSEK
ncbi:MAG: hypothetical protein JNK85_18795 [Verrucomicrobiales bacterium]|nr:hypothetical protein [Verrucomicrobiales bacterium]